VCVCQGEDAEYRRRYQDGDDVIARALEGHVVCTRACNRVRAIAATTSPMELVEGAEASHNK